ncbi:MAG: chorismate synthase [Muribaculaceae bacterium]|nr:chorismate synthase [Muribaculaceae bacterium]
MNTIGKLLRLTTFGESHGPAVGGVLDGMPPGLYLDFEQIACAMARRRPGSGVGVSQRHESDNVEFLSGISDKGFTLGTPIGFIIRNHDARSEDYDEYTGALRPNHADLTYFRKYGYTQLPGGGRASARVTAPCVAAGAIAAQWLESQGIGIRSKFIPTNDIEQVRKAGDTTGGIVRCTITGIKLPIGEPVFGKFQAKLAEAMMGINAAKGFEYGDGFASSSMLGSESADKYYLDTEGEIRTLTNHSGGIQGGIANGEPVEFRVHFKPTPTLMQKLDTLNISGERVVVPPKGRHDSCVAVRAAAIVEAMTALVTADMMMIHRARL